MWTLHAGEVYVACQLDCEDEQLMLDGSRNPPLIALCAAPEETPKMEHQREGGVGPRKGGDARTTDVLEMGQAEPPPGFLELLWEGWDA